MAAPPVRTSEAGFAEFHDKTFGPAEAVPEMESLFRRKAPWESLDDSAW